MIDYFCFEGKPIAAVRMTQRTKWGKAEQAYLAYKGALARAIALEYPRLVLPAPPPAQLNTALLGTLCTPQ